MKKVLAVLLAGIILLATASCSKPAEDTSPYKPQVTEVKEEDKIVYFKDAVKGDKEQGPVWFYLFDDGSGYKELYYTEEWGDNWQYSDHPTVDNVYYSIFDQDDAEGVHQNYVWAGPYGDLNVKIIIGWRAYQDGTAKIGRWDFTAYEYQDMVNKLDGGIVTILKNREELFSATTTASGDNIFEGKEVEVKEGDMIFFVFDGNNLPKASFLITDLSVELN